MPRLPIIDISHPTLDNVPPCSAASRIADHGPRHREYDGNSVLPLVWSYNDHLKRVQISWDEERRGLITNGGLRKPLRLFLHDADAEGTYIGEKDMVLKD